VSGLCEECHTRPATVRPSREKSVKLGAPTHGWVCDPCLLMLELAVRSCPPRRGENPEVLAKRETTALKHAKKQDGSAKWARQKAVELAESTGSIPGIIEEVIGRNPRGPGDLWCGERGWLFGFLAPEIEGYVRELTRASFGEYVAAAESRAKANKLGFRRTVAQKSVVDLDNPFEYPDFLEKMMDGLRVVPRPQHAYRFGLRERVMVTAWLARPMGTVVARSVHGKLRPREVYMVEVSGARGPARMYFPSKDLEPAVMAGRVR